RILAPDLSIRSCPVGALSDIVCAAHEAALAPDIDRLLALAQVSPPRAKDVGSAIARERLASRPVATCWIMRLPASTGFWAQLRQGRGPHKLAPMMVFFAIVDGLEIVGWGIIGEAGLDGRVR